MYLNHLISASIHTTAFTDHDEILIDALWSTIFPMIPTLQIDISFTPNRCKHNTKHPLPTISSHFSFHLQIANLAFNLFPVISSYHLPCSISSTVFLAKNENMSLSSTPPSWPIYGVKCHRQQVEQIAKHVYPISELKSMRELEKGK